MTIFVYTDNRQSRVISSVGRAPALQAGCRRFEPVIAHQTLCSWYEGTVELGLRLSDECSLYRTLNIVHRSRPRGVVVNMPACHAGDRRFKSDRGRQNR